jgi:hypothetical protein
MIPLANLCEAVRTCGGVGSASGRKIVLDLLCRRATLPRRPFAAKGRIMHSIGEVLLVLLGFGGVVAVAAIILLVIDLGRGRTNLKIIQKQAVAGVEAIVFLGGQLFNFLVGALLFLLVLYAAIWIIKRMWEAA